MNVSKVINDVEILIAVSMLYNDVMIVERTALKRCSLLREAELEALASNYKQDIVDESFIKRKLII